jgi:photosystem II stability/assembly factor-like uncharacterized protein
LLLHLAFSVASAHRPHTPVTALAAEPGYPAWLVLESNQTSQVMRSDDGGRFWDPVASPAKRDLMVGGGAFGGVITFVANDGTIWSSAADGASWRAIETGLGPQRGRVGADGVVVLIDGGVVQPYRDGVAERAVVWDRTVSDVARGVGVSWLVDASGALASWVDGADPMEVPGPGPFRSVAVGSRGALAATDGGLFERVDGRWSACAPIEPTAAGEYADQIGNVGVTSDGASWVVATGQQVFVGDCVSWEPLPWPDADVLAYGAEVGSITDPSDAWTQWVVGPNLTIIAGWNGVLTDRGGPTLDDPPLLTEAYLRGLAFAPSWPLDPRVFVGGYGGGVRYTEDGGATWSGTAAGSVGSFVYALVATAPPATWVYSGNYEIHSSVDGAFWTWWPDGPFERVQYLASDGLVVWALGGPQSEDTSGHLARSTDLGATWSELPAFTSVAAQAASLRHTRLLGRDTLLVATFHPAAVARSLDGGASFEVLHADDSIGEATLAVWPPTLPTRLLVATEDGGVLLSDDGGDTLRAPTAPPEGPPQLLVEGADGALFVVDRAGSVARSYDGGETWDAPGDPIAPAVFTVVAAPDPAAAGLLLAGTHAGLYVSYDAGQTWGPARSEVRMEDNTPHIDCVRPGGAPCLTYVSKTAGNWGGWALEVGDTLSFVCRGSEARVIGPGANGSIVVTVDGARGPEVAARTNPLPLGDDGWHDVVIEVTDGEAVEVDRVDCVDDAAPFAVPPEPARGGCGGRAWVVAPLLLAVRRRVRTTR